MLSEGAYTQNNTSRSKYQSMKTDNNNHYAYIQITTIKTNKYEWIFLNEVGGRRKKNMEARRVLTQVEKGVLAEKKGGGAGRGDTRKGRQ